VVAGRGRGPGELQLSSTLLYLRTVVTGPLVMFDVVPTLPDGQPDGPGPNVLVPRGLAESEGKNCYTSARRLLRSNRG